MRTVPNEFCRWPQGTVINPEWPCWRPSAHDSCESRSHSALVLRHALELNSESPSTERQLRSAKTVALGTWAPVSNEAHFPRPAFDSWFTVETAMTRNHSR